MPQLPYFYVPASQICLHTDAADLADIHSQS